MIEVAALRLRERMLSLDSPVLMGVVNVNSDSFSDPGPRTTRQAVAQAVALLEDKAQIIDIGAQSSITRRAPIPADIELAAIVPVIRELRRARPDVLISVDTFKQAVAEAALAEGAHIINDVSGLRDLEIARTCARYGAGLVIMHTSAPPLTRLQDIGHYRDIGTEVAAYLGEQRDLAVQCGVHTDSIILDPGPDFTKTPAQTIELLQNIHHVISLGHPILLALSRKDFIGALTSRRPSDRTAGTLAALAALRHVPHQIVRVHDVAAAVDMFTVLDALCGSTMVPPNLTLANELRHQPS